jgi:hypothetical protein
MAPYSLSILGRSVVLQVSALFKFPGKLIQFIQSFDGLLLVSLAQQTFLSQILLHSEEKEIAIRILQEPLLGEPIELVRHVSYCSVVEKLASL